MTSSDPLPPVDSQVVINDLLEQIKRLTLDNAVLRAVVATMRSAPAEQITEI